MLPVRLLVHEVAWQQAASTTDEYGNVSSPEWATPLTRPIRGRLEQASLAQREETVGRQDVAAAWVFLTNEMGVGPADRIVWDGIAFEVAGQPARVAGAGPDHHLEVPLRAVV